jgi:tetratricopeptide (TPR) repeat protein
MGQSNSETQTSGWSLSRMLWNFWRNLFSGVYIILAFMLVFAAFGNNTEIKPPEIVFFFTLAVYFPFTYLAYWAVRTEMRRSRLEEELSLLGYSREEATQLYKQVHDQTSYLLFITLAMLTTIIGTSFLFGIPESLPIDPVTVQAMRYGFFGSYLFSAFLVYRRFSTNDLHPTVFLYATFTMIAGMVFNYVAVEALTSITGTSGEAEGVGAGLLAILAFALGYFPYLAVRWFNRLAFTSLGVDKRRTDALPLSLIDGISEWHETRLRDTGIDDIQNLASAEIRELLVNTAFNAQEIIEWIDQATLYLYLENPNEIDSFRRAKIRMTSDFCSLWEQCRDDTEKRSKVVQNLQSTEERLTVLYSSLNEGPNVHRVRDYWQRAKSRVNTYLNIVNLRGQLDKLKDVAQRFDNTPESQSQILAELAKEYGGLVRKLWHDLDDEDILSLGKLYLSLNEYDKANEQFSDIIDRIKASALTDTQFNAYRSRIFASTLKRNQEAAVQDCDVLLEKTANMLSFQTEAHAIKGDVLANFFQYDEAVKAYEKAIELAPHDSQMQNRLAWHYALYQSNIEKLPIALEIAQKAVQLARGKDHYPDALDTLAYVQILFADAIAQSDTTDNRIVQLYNEAFDNLKAALEYDPESIPKFGYDAIRDHLQLIAEFWSYRRESDAQAIEHEENILLTMLRIPTLTAEERAAIAMHLKAIRFVPMELLPALKTTAPYELPAPIMPVEPPMDSSQPA